MPHHSWYIDETIECLLKNITYCALKSTRLQVGVTWIHRQKEWNNWCRQYWMPCGPWPVNACLWQAKNVIIEGEIKPVEHPSKSSLARRFGVNRGPLCEAIGQLECHRLVECKSNLGAGVVPFLIQIWFTLSWSVKASILWPSEWPQLVWGSCSLTTLKTSVLSCQKRGTKVGKGIFSMPWWRWLSLSHFARMWEPALDWSFGYWSLLLFLASSTSSIDTPWSSRYCPSRALRNRWSA